MIDETFYRYEASIGYDVPIHTLELQKEGTILVTTFGGEECVYPKDTLVDIKVFEVKNASNVLEFIALTQQNDIYVGLDCEEPNALLQQVSGPIDLSYWENIYFEDLHDVFNYGLFLKEVGTKVVELKDLLEDF